MDKLAAARKQYAELQQMVKNAGADPATVNALIKQGGLQDLVRTAAGDAQARRALEQKLSEAAAQSRRRAQGPGQTGEQDRSQARRAKSQADRSQGNYAPTTRPAPVMQTSDPATQPPGTFLGLDAERFRQAFIIKEILSPPPSLRDDDF